MGIKDTNCQGGELGNDYWLENYREEWERNRRKVLRGVWDAGTASLETPELFPTYGLIPLI